jgi:xanthine phosphoribosyltransferase
MKYYSYENFKKDTKILQKQIKNFTPEAIIGVARGGLTLSHAIAEGLNIREVQTIRTELYDNTSKRDALSIFGECAFSNVSRVLVVDDIADSGETLKAVMNHLESKFKNITFKSCTLFYKKTSVYEPDFWVNEADDWIDFFWESDFKAE